MGITETMGFPRYISLGEFLKGCGGTSFKKFPHKNSVSLYVNILHIAVAVFGDELLSCREVVAKQGIKDHFGSGGICGGDRDQPSGCRMYRH